MRRGISGLPRRWGGCRWYSGNAAEEDGIAGKGGGLDVEGAEVVEDEAVDLGGGGGKGGGVVRGVGGRRGPERVNLREGGGCESGRYSSWRNEPDLRVSGLFLMEQIPGEGESRWGIFDAEGAETLRKKGVERKGDLGSFGNTRCAGR
jgi:hypothetical protein